VFVNNSNNQIRAKIFELDLGLEELMEGLFLIIPMIVKKGKREAKLCGLE
jgi:hypothetical protein